MPLWVQDPEGMEYTSSRAIRQLRIHDTRMSGTVNLFARTANGESLIARLDTIGEAQDALADLLQKLDSESLGKNLILSHHPINGWESWQPSTWKRA